MTVRFELANNMADCHSSWQNFCGYCQDTHYDGDHTHWVPDEIFNSELERYGGKAYFGAFNYIMFDTEQGLSMFLLRWS
jgi:hypothetical protein